MRRTFLALIILLIATGLVFATGSQQAGKSAGVPEVVVQFMSEPPVDKDMVTEAINKILPDRVGATVKFQNLTWTNWQENYRLLLASRAPVDVLYAANWNSYPQYARDGAYMALDKLAPQAIPKLWDAIPQASWDGVKIDGSIYAVPTLRYAYSGSFHALWREDLRKQYGTPPITDMATFQQYWDAVKAKNPSMYPVDEDGTGWMTTYFPYLIAKDNANSAWSTGLLSQSWLQWIDYKNLRTAPKAPWEFPEYRAFLQAMRDYAQKGYWAQDVLAYTSIQTDRLEAGTTASIVGGGQNTDKVQELIQRVAKNNPTWEIGDFSWDQKRGFAIPSAAQQDLSTIPIQSKYPELGLKIVQAFMLDEDLQRLIDYGIEGVHYEVNAQGEYVQLPEAKNYVVFGMAAWAWKNQSLFLADGSVWGHEHDAYMKSYDKIAVPNVGFGLDPDPITTELTACLQVEKQYGYPLWSGLVSNIDEGERIFEQKLKEAGFDKVRAELQKQFNAYLAEIGK